MKFKAYFTDEGVNLLEKRFVPALERLSKTCHVYLTADDVFFLQNALSNDGVQSITQFPKDILFTDYRIRSQNENRIGFSIDLGHLQRALKSGVSMDGDMLQLKLVKKAQSQTERASPFLTFESKGHRSAIVQDVPISPPLTVSDVKELQDVIDLLEELPQTLVQLPELVQLQSQIEKLKSVGDVLEVGVSQWGDLTLTISTSLVSIGTEYRGLQVWGKQQAGTEQSEASMTSSMRLQRAIEKGQASSVKVNLKHFAKSLLCHLTKPDASFCGIAADKSCLLLMFQYAEESSISLQYRLPVLESDQGM